MNTFIYAVSDWIYIIFCFCLNQMVTRNIFIFLALHPYQYVTFKQQLHHDWYYWYWYWYYVNINSNVITLCSHTGKFALQLAAGMVTVLYLSQLYGNMSVSHSEYSKRASQLNAVIFFFILPDAAFLKYLNMKYCIRVFH